ncbi:hypothetical protein D3C71_1210560 [compost metagenome]
MNAKICPGGEEKERNYAQSRQIKKRVKNPEQSQHNHRIGPQFFDQYINQRRKKHHNHQVTDKPKGRVDRQGFLRKRIHVRSIPEGPEPIQ